MAIAATLGASFSVRTTVQVLPPSVERETPFPAAKRILPSFASAASAVTDWPFSPARVKAGAVIGTAGTVLAAPAVAGATARVGAFVGLGRGVGTAGRVAVAVGAGASVGAG